MKLEYLFEDQEHKNDIEQYKKESVAIDIRNVEGKECWIVSFSIEGENVDSAKILSRINDEIIEKYAPTVLTNECSAYYNKRLFPYFNEFERKLRKLLYLNSATHKEIEGIDVIEKLESQDLGEIFATLFTDDKFIKEAKNKVNAKTWKYTKKEIIETLQQIAEESLWSKLIGSETLGVLEANFARVRKYRNDVMHAHNIDEKTYNEAKKLINNINNQLDDAINEMLTPTTVKNVHHDENFNSILSAAIKAAELQERLNKNQAIIALQKVYSELNSQNVWDAIDNYRKAIDNTPLVEMQRNIEELQKSFAAFRKAQQEITNSNNQNCDINKFENSGE